MSFFVKEDSSLAYIATHLRYVGTVGSSFVEMSSMMTVGKSYLLLCDKGWALRVKNDDETVYEEHPMLVVDFWDDGSAGATKYGITSNGWSGGGHIAGFSRWPSALSGKSTPDTKESRGADL